MRLRLLAAASVMLVSSLAARADNINYTLTGNGQTLTFTLAQTPTVSATDGHSFYTPVTYLNGTTTTTGEILFGYARNGYDASFQLSGINDVSSTNAYFTGTTTAPMLSAGHFIFTATGSRIGDPSYTATLDAVLATPTAVTAASVAPEPSSLALLGTGVLGVLGAARRRFA